MNGDLEAWSNASALTMSFVPDGTSVGASPSQLAATWQPLGSTAQWQSAISRAFQTWAQHANVNLGVVADDGSPMGERGLTHGDSRFGDVRVAGSPMSADTWAAAVDEHRVFAGTWTGDTFFNTDAVWSSLDDVYAAALHEAGHVLGLPHSDDPASPMHTHGLTASVTPTAADIALLQSLYGARVPDEHESQANNDTRSKATSIDDAEASDGFDGSAPLVEFGDLHATTDADFYMLPVLLGYDGAISFDVRTQGLSLMRPRVTVFDRHGDQLATSTVSDPLGGTAHVQVSGPFDEKLYVRVDSTAGDLFALGGYALIASYDGLDTTDPAVVSGAVREGFRWRGLTDRSLATINLGPLLRGDDDADYDDDAGSDDDGQSGRSLDPVDEGAERLKYQYVGTLSATGDVDHYKIAAPTFGSGEQRNLTLAVEALKLDGVIADVAVFDDKGNAIPYETSANGAGLVMLFVPNVQSNLDYVVQVRTSSAAKVGERGNYSFHATFDTSTPGFREFARGSVSPETPEQVFTLYVAQSQLFTFVLDSTPGPDSQGSVAWVTILDDHKRPVFLAAGPAGQSRSATSGILAPGEYRFVVSSRQADGVTPASVDFVVRGRQSSDPVGPPVIDASVTPLYSCESDPTAYCYPGNLIVSDPFVTVTGGPPSAGTGGAPVITPPDTWFWTTPYVRTNPITPVDVVPDAVVAPVDALQVINFINDNPSGIMPIPPVALPYLDVNYDGWVSPIDALMVINHLNLVAGAEGESPPALDAAGASVPVASEPERLATSAASAPSTAPSRTGEAAPTTSSEPKPSAPPRRRRWPSLGDGAGLVQFLAKSLGMRG